MNSRWGIDLDISAVRLMRREGGHWQEVARENIDGADIEDRLAAMISQVDEGAAVELFLPRDQILYTDVDVSSEADAQAEISAALDGQTPYSLDELEIDWAITEPGKARVCAIAKETLQEAAAFAEDRELQVAGFSSLADLEDFPRLPTFGANHRVEDEPDEPAAPEPETTPAFSTVRKSQSPDLPTLTRDASEDEGPVVKVEDSAPVMRVKDITLPPLDPGTPLTQELSAPRVRTDIAAGTLSGAAATLSPSGPSVKVRNRKVGAMRTLLVFGVAAILTIGIAIIVWSILPMAPGRTDSEPTVAPETSQAAQPEEEVEVASEPDLPVPVITAEVSGLSDAPDTSSPPILPSTDSFSLTRLDPTAPFAPEKAAVPTRPEDIPAGRPAHFAGIQTTAPAQSLDGSEDTAETTLGIYFASVERGALAFDAIALPPASDFSASLLPETPQPPKPASEELEVALADPAIDLTPESAETPEVVQETVEDETPTPEVDPTEETQPEEVATGSDPDETTLRPSELAASLPGRGPRARPADMVARIERQRFGGNTRSELAGIKPKARPQSAQALSLAEREPAAASELAVQTSRQPRTRPDDFDALVATAQLKAQEERSAASQNFDTPDTSAAIEAALADDAEPEPRPQTTPQISIPSSASVARQATIEDAIRLSKINLIGVYGLPSDRRALVRLSSGRYVKVKVGDRIDGGTVARIDDSQLIYRKGSRNIALALPKS